MNLFSKLRKTDIQIAMKYRQTAKYSQQNSLRPFEEGWLQKKKKADIWYHTNRYKTIYLNAFPSVKFYRNKIEQFIKWLITAHEK